MLENLTNIISKQLFNVFEGRNPVEKPEKFEKLNEKLYEFFQRRHDPAPNLGAGAVEKITLPKFCSESVYFK